MLRIISLWLVLTVGLAFGNPAHAQEPFYKGKVIRIIVAYSAGGGYDIYSRIIARHTGKYIPGNPTIIVDNMVGAGGIIAANHVYKVAKPDGLTIGHFVGSLFLQQFVGKSGIEFESLKYEFLGAPAQDTQLLAVAKRTGITSVEQWMASKTVVKFGTSGQGSANEDIARVVKAAVGLPIQLVSGYKGTSDIRLAFNSGEVNGICNAWESFKGTWPNELQSGDVVILLQAAGKRHPELPKVPLAIDYAKTDEARKLIQAAVNNYGATARPYVLPPGTPKDRVAVLRKAFMETMKDAEFIAEIKKAKLEIDAIDGATLEQNVKDIFALDAALVPKLAEILK